jgi:hypothetical protein
MNRKIALILIILCICVIGIALSLEYIKIEERKGAEKIWDDTINAVNEVKTVKYNSTEKVVLPNKTIESVVHAEVDFEARNAHIIIETDGEIVEQWFINDTTYFRSDTQIEEVPIIWTGEDKLVRILGLYGEPEIEFEFFVSEEINGKDCWLLQIEKTIKRPPDKNIFEEGKVWIAKDDCLPVKRESHSIVPPNATIYATTVLYDYNKPVSVLVPV